MDKKLFGIFIAQQSTTLENINLIIEKFQQDPQNEFIFINQSNIYRNNLDINLTLSQKNIFKFKKPIFKIKNPYSPSIFTKLIYFLKIHFYLKKYIYKADFLCFSPGGFIEGEIARLVKLKKGKVIQIEGGLPNDLIYRKNNNKLPKKNSILYKLPIKRFSKNPRMNPLAYVDYFISSGKISKKMHSELNYEAKKILDYGLPRFEHLFTKKKINIQEIKNIVYVAGAYEFHNEINQSQQMIKDISEINEFLEKISHLNFLVKLHPRQSCNETKIIKTLNIETVNDMEFSKLISLNKTIVLTRYSNLAYELLFQNIPTFFYNPPVLILNDQILPEKALTLYNVEDIFNIVNNKEDLKNKEFSNYSKDFYSQNTPNSTIDITNLLKGLKK